MYYTKPYEHVTRLESPLRNFVAQSCTMRLVMAIKSPTLNPKASAGIFEVLGVALRYRGMER